MKLLSQQLYNPFYVADLFSQLKLCDSSARRIVRILNSNLSQVKNVTHKVALSKFLRQIDVTRVAADKSPGASSPNLDSYVNVSKCEILATLAFFYFIRSNLI